MFGGFKVSTVLSSYNDIVASNIETDCFSCMKTCTTNVGGKSLY